MTKTELFLAMMMSMAPRVSGQDCMGALGAWMGGDPPCLDMANPDDMSNICTDVCQEKTAAMFDACKDAGIIPEADMEGLKSLIDPNFCSCLNSLSDIMPMGPDEDPATKCINEAAMDMEKLCGADCVSKLDTAGSSCGQVPMMAENPAMQGLFFLQDVCKDPCLKPMITIIYKPECVPGSRRLGSHNTGAEPEPFVMPTFTATEVCNPNCNPLFCAMSSKCSTTTAPKIDMPGMVISNDQWVAGHSNVMTELEGCACPADSEDSSGAIGLSGISVLGLLILMLAVN